MREILRHLELYTALFSSPMSIYHCTSRVCVCVCVCSIMAMQSVSMGCYDAPAMYILQLQVDSVDITAVVAHVGGRSIGIHPRKR